MHVDEGELFYLADHAACGTSIDVVESSVHDGQGALRHHPEARDIFTIMTKHPGTSRAVPNTLTDTQ